MTPTDYDGYAVSCFGESDDWMSASVKIKMMKNRIYSAGFWTIIRKTHSSILFWGALILTFSSGCNKEKDDGGFHQCLIHLIKGHEKACHVEVFKYEYNDQIVYLITPNCPDAMHKLYDTQCNYICSPWGGFSGQGDAKCPDFGENAVQLDVIYQTP